MKIYISIPITGHDEKTQRANARYIADRLRAMGHEPVNPFDKPAVPAILPDVLSDKEKYAMYMGWDIRELLLCDAVVFAFGWRHSKGCLLEHRAAEIYGLRQYYDLTKIPEL